MAKSGHGALIWWEPMPGQPFVQIAELGDITTPSLTRKEFDATTQNLNMDTYVTGVLRRDVLTFKMNFMESGEPTHDHVTGIQAGIIDNLTRGWKYTFPSGLAWIMSGQVTIVKLTDPVTGCRAATSRCA